ncbi:MAG: iron-containing alcohol dehydrogenase [Ruminococcaceae bacterium]|nr:iron-containing alcohol dehydrogenase [Oscillospiraceae bacterium]
MFDFNYYTPTEVIFGKNAEEQVGKSVKKQSCKKVLIHYGGNSALRSGLIDRIKSSLDDASIEYVLLGGVVPNPRLSLVYEGIELCRKEGVDFILAVGGGSVIDSAKAIGYGVASGGDAWDFFNFKRKPSACLPIGVVLTIAAAGSEMSNSCVITNGDGQIKRGCTSDLSRPRFAIMNPELTMTLPAYQTSCGCVDILMHTMERYFTPGGNMELTDGIAEALMRTVINNARILMKDPTNYNARAEIMWAGSLSHNGLTGCGNGGNDFATHRIEHELSGNYDVAHGAGLAALWGTWARYVLDNIPERFYKFATRVMGCAESEDIKATALEGICAIEDFFREINMPTSIKELGLDLCDDDLAVMARKCAITTRGHTGSAKVLYEADMLNIFRGANK